MLSLRFTLQEDDVLAFAFRRLRMRRPFAVLGIAVCAIALSGLASSAIDFARGERVEWSMVYLCAVFAACPLFMFVFLPWLIRRNFRKNPFAGESQELTFSDEGIDSRSERGHTRFRWDDFGEVVERKNHVFLILRATILGLTIPKRALRDATELEALRTLIDAHVEKCDWAESPR